MGEPGRGRVGAQRDNACQGEVAFPLVRQQHSHPALGSLVAAPQRMGTAGRREQRRGKPLLARIEKTGGLRRAAPVGRVRQVKQPPEQRAILCSGGKSVQ